MIKNFIKPFIFAKKTFTLVYISTIDISFLKQIGYNRIRIINMR